jgi:hypothetical protein
MILSARDSEHHMLIAIMIADGQSRTRLEGPPGDCHERTTEREVVNRITFKLLPFIGSGGLNGRC